DLGLGALAALGLRFADEAGNEIAVPTPEHWPRISRIVGAVGSDMPRIRIACDVANPLLGPNGAAAVHGAQKGLEAGDTRLEIETARMSSLLCAHAGCDPVPREAPGAGAAGGIAVGLMC